MDLLESLTLALSASWASGLNLYATALILGGLHALGLVTLPAGLEMLGDPTVLAVAAAMYAIEFFADKIPGVDTVWDVIHTFIRIPAGALMAAGAMGDQGELAFVGALLAGGAITSGTHAVAGGAITGGTHAAKAGSRALINTSPEPFTNWAASIAEDIAAIGGILLAIVAPTAFLVGFAIFVLLLVWLLPKVWRGIRWFVSRLTKPPAETRRETAKGLPALRGAPAAGEDGDAAFR